MKTMLINVMAAAAVTALSGCATVYRVSETSCPDPGVQYAAPATRNPVVRVDVMAGGEQSDDLAAAVRSEVENSLASRGFSVSTKSRPDSSVSVSLVCRSKDKLADWKLYEGKAEVRISETDSGKLVASKSFTAGGERAIDVEKAMKGVKEGLAHQMLPWLDKALPMRKVSLPPPPPAPAAALVTITPADRSESQESVLAVQRNFMDSIAAHPGVVDCRLVREVPAECAYTFVVAYDPNAFPGGLLNTIVLDAPELGENVKLVIVR